MDPAAAHDTYRSVLPPICNARWEARSAAKARNVRLGSPIDVTAPSVLELLTDSGQGQGPRRLVSIPAGALGMVHGGARRELRSHEDVKSEHE